MKPEINIVVNVDARKALRTLKEVRKQVRWIYLRQFWYGWACGVIGTAGGVVIYHVFFT